MKPNEFISILRKSDDYIKTIYMNGGCYQFYKILKTLYPQATPLIDTDKGHIVTVIDNVQYDITGIVDGSFFPLTKEDISMCESWSFSNSYWLAKNCPMCDEPVHAPAQI
ncbi:hypothetical protein ACNA6I_01185 [Rossellomorea sp. FS2]|uniref:hypothetical protein n=1 Tax=Rossellomorea sp. FS2 TaxID=3391447 RepID=UPI003A4D56EE